MADEPITLVRVDNQDIDTRNVKVPSDRTFRDAWQLDGRVIKVNMTRAKETALTMVRQARQPLLDELDRLHNRAMGQNKSEDAKTIEGKRQRLRDMTEDKRLSAKTPEQLKSGLDAILKEMEEVARA